MSYHFVSKSGDLYCNQELWPKLFRVAVFFGWKPAGTTQPIENHPDDFPEKQYPFPDWDGNYFCNEWQYFKDDDAKNCAAALRETSDYLLELAAVLEGGTVQIG